MNLEEKLRIANSGGYFKETGKHSWVGIQIRKGNRYGEVIEDWNGRFRKLKVRFQDGEIEEIVLNNLGKDLDYVHEYEFYSGGRWFKF